MNTTPFRGRHVHLMGIGGAGVGALVPLLRAAGAQVSGCDAGDGASVERQRAGGISIALGHAPTHLAGVDLLVHTAAVSPDHPEIVAAQQAGVAVLTRAQCLVKLMEGSRTLAVAGSHGKSSTTWMLGHLLVEAGADPVVMVGGGVASLGQGGARVGRGALFVAETDESDGSFASVHPEIAVVTNLDDEHLRHYGSFAALELAFAAWLRGIPVHGCAVLPVAGVSPRLSEGLACRVVRCGLDAGDVHASELRLGAEGSTLRVIAHGRDLGETTVPIPGVHMVLNALQAIAAALVVEPRIAVGALASCERVGRRFTVHGAPRGVRVVEDYGHHPTELRATIAAARLGGGRVHVLFQPHRFTRTVDCFADFVAAFDQAHSVAVAPIYAASEAPIDGASHHDLAAALDARRQQAGAEAPALAFDDLQLAAMFLAREARAGDTCLVLGAGDVGKAAPLLLQHLQEGGDGSSPTPTALLACQGATTW